jgi:hypothetical protein
MRRLEAVVLEGGMPGREGSPSVCTELLREHRQQDDVAGSGSRLEPSIRGGCVRDPLVS